MNRLKFLLSAAVLAFGLSTPAMAQDAEDEPTWFVGVQGGIQNTLNSHFNNWKTITPTAAISVGKFFSPEVGARLNLNGMWNKGAASNMMGNVATGYWKYNYLTTSADLLINLCTTFGNKDYYPVNLYMIGGLGLYHAWNNDEAADLAAQAYRLYNTEEDKRNAFNGRLGLQLEYKINPSVAVNLESTYNMHAGQHATFAPDDDQLLVLAGLTYRFGRQKAEVEEEQWETRVDTIWYNEDTFTPRVENGNMTWNVFYEIRESDYIDANQQLAKIGAFLKDHRECKVTVKSYADRGTGNPKINMEYSQQRNEKAVEALVAAGVSRSIITAEYYGDTIQPFADNDRNRVTIVTATGLKDVKDKSTVRKFRTEEKQVLVK